MIWIVLSILLSTYLGLTFKIFDKFKISTLQAIVINYWVCIITGCIFMGEIPFTKEHFQASYTSWAAIQGFFFFIVFSAISQSTILLGVSTTQVSNKLSLVIPAVLAIYLFADKFSILKIIGLILAIIAVALVTFKSKPKDGAVVKINSLASNANNWLLPLVIFIGSGLLDTLIAWVQKVHFTVPADKNIYIIFCFAASAITGTLYLLYMLFTKKQVFNPKAIIAGLALGIPNYFSFYTLVKAMDAKVFNTSALIPINNMGIVLVSTLAAIIMFKEKLITKNYIGLILAILAILAVIIGDK
jgi:uncharacterized membrane protein